MFNYNIVYLVNLTQGDQVIEKTRHKLLSFILIDLIILVGFVVYFGVVRPYIQKPLPINGILTTPQMIKDFQLTDTNNKPFTKQNFLGHWTFLYFGFTDCPMACPLTLKKLKNVIELINLNYPDIKSPQVVFITVDPENDSLVKVKSYLKSFNKDFLGASAEMSKIIAFEKQVSVFNSATNPNMHSTDVLLITPKAEVRAYFPFKLTADQIAKDYQAVYRHG